MNQTGQSGKIPKVRAVIPILLSGFLCCACAHLKKPQAVNSEPSAVEQLSARNNVASLFYDLVGDEKNVGQLLMIKRNSEELGRLIRAIAKVAADDEQQLKSLAANDPNVNLRAIKLPQGEVETRDAVSKSKETALLFSSGSEFEFNLLLTQAEALITAGT